MSASAADRPLVLALMGPTASGKTALAIKLAQRHGGEIISVDSALVYRGLDIGSAKPDAEERAGIPHHLIDIREPDQPYSAGEFAQDARAAVNAVLARGNLPLLVGGTGLYFRALLGGLSAMPASEPEVRAAIECEAAERGWAALHAELAQVDPEAAARIRPSDPQRITRALEVWRVSGRAISAWQREAPLSPRPPWRVLKLVLAPADRSQLHARIAQRFERMVGQGFLDEVRALMARSELHPDLPAMRAVGYRQAWRHLRGETSMADFLAEGIAATRQLAKRQLTWLRAELDAFRVDPLTDPARAEALFRLASGLDGR
ncbi:tRNA dimethylallyltransferase [Aquimonas voraii]|uniref:tRNA dimethylallyltransferase n=2 Tax=Aquimonas voraii TaxID=265719 RepID=A0A1G6SCJ6_9GAMM|nr:tRNA dimethylallyltransferase [Aquimonas voraii]